MRNLWTLVLSTGLSACQPATPETPAVDDPTRTDRPVTPPVNAAEPPEPRPEVTTRPAASAPVIVELPPARAGAVARAWLDAVNSGEEAQLRTLLEQRLAKEARAAAPLAVWLTYCKDLAVQSGGLDVVRVEPATAGDEVVRFHVRARRVDRHAVLTLRVDEHDEIVDLDARPEPDPTTADAEPLPAVAMSEAEVVRAIERRLERLAATDGFSGAVIVAKGDRLLVGVAHGHADQAFAVANRIDTKFNLGSMNKMFTAVAIGQLVEAGKLSFDDTLAEVLPDYPNRAFASKATIHHLLTHTSGIGGTIFPPALFENRDRYERPAEYLPLFADEPPEFPPGTRFSYANPGFVVLGLVIERVSGEDYDDYVRDNIFAPAGMRDTAAHDWDEVTPGLAVGYMRDRADALGLLPRRTNVPTLPFRGTPAGGGYSTVIDLRAFADALRGHRLVGAAMVETLTSPKIETPFMNPPRRYGYGFMTHLVDGKEIRGHGGGAPGINGELHMFWDGSYTVAVLGNYDHPNALDVANEISAFLAAQGP
jgi:D-alanyl-D-alanine carboxypeptidase